MGASPLQVLKDGDVVQSNGIRFTFWASIPDVASTTTSEPAGFSWQWMLIGRIFVAQGGAVGRGDGGVMCGQHDGRFHGLSLPQAEDGLFAYQDVELAMLNVTPKVRKSLFGKPKLEAVAIKLSDQFGLAAHSANRLDSAGNPDRTDRLGEFCAEFGQSV